MPKRSFALLLSVCLVLIPASAAADVDGAVRFATLPKGDDEPRFPEGIAADDAGRIYVATFEFDALRQPNVIHVFDRNGDLEETIPMPTGVVPLGLEFDSQGNLYVANFGGGTVLRYAPPFTSRSEPERSFAVCGGAGAGCGLNAITFDDKGDLYVSDSFGGNVFKLHLPNGRVTTFVSNDLLKPGSHGFPPFGANGLAFRGKVLYIANTADDRILKYDPAVKDAAKRLTVFAESINGADGIAFDSSGRLWVAANQGDEIVALNANGRLIERRGGFNGIGPDGAAKGLLFPASIVIKAGSIYVTNLALALTAAIGDEPEEDVTTYTVSKVPLD